jgi:hypothetical protein
VKCHCILLVTEVESENVNPVFSRVRGALARSKTNRSHTLNATPSAHSGRSATIITLLSPPSVANHSAQHELLKYILYKTVP